jgi:hypothetical protein
MDPTLAVGFIIAELERIVHMSHEEARLGKGLVRNMVLVTGSRHCTPGGSLHIAERPASQSDVFGARKLSDVAGVHICRLERVAPSRGRWCFRAALSARWTQRFALDPSSILLVMLAGERGQDDIITKMPNVVLRLLPGVHIVVV